MTERSAIENANPRFDGMVEELASAVRRRYHSAMLEGMTDQAAFEEIVRTVLQGYREALAS